MSACGTTVVVQQPPWIDSCGNIRLNGRTAVWLVITFMDGCGNLLDVSQSVYGFEIDGVLEATLTPVSGQPSQQLLYLPQEDVAQVGISPNPKVGPFFVLRDETAGESQGVVIWEGMFIVRAFTEEPV